MTEIVVPRLIPALQAAIILVVMASGKSIWRLKFWRKSRIVDQQIKRETYLKNNQKLGKSNQ